MIRRYQITEEESRKHCADKVCIYCGEPLEPIETVDNARNPTFWTGCMKCSRFNPGTTEEIYQKALSLKEDFRTIPIETLVSIVNTLYADHLTALAEKDNTPDFARGFRAGQDSIRRKNESGCCCKFDELTGEILSCCATHKEYVEIALAEKDKVIEVFQDDTVIRKAHIEHLEEQIAKAQRVWDELSVILSCTSPDGDTELEQVRYLQEQIAALKADIKLLELYLDNTRKDKAVLMGALYREALRGGEGRDERD